MPKTIALIPARAGSKGIPKKNLANLGNGETLLSRTIRHSFEASLIDSVYVSTEDEEIYKEAMGCGSKIIHRPSKLATDEATTESVISHAIKTLDLDPLDTIVLLQCTSPFRTRGQLDEALRLFSNIKHTYQSMASVIPFHGQMWIYTNKHWAVVERNRKRRQEQQEKFIETGSFYIFTVNSFLVNKNRIGYNPLGFLVPDCDKIEVDTEFDLEIVRSLIYNKEYKK